MQHDAAAVPVRGHFEFTSIQPGRIRFRNFGRDETKSRIEGHLNVGVVGTIEALHRPVARNLDLSPRVVRVVGFEKLWVREGWRPTQLEPPTSV